MQHFVFFCHKIQAILQKKKKDLFGYLNCYQYLHLKVSNRDFVRNIVNESPDSQNGYLSRLKSHLNTHMQNKGEQN